MALKEKIKIEYLGDRKEFLDEVADIWVHEWASEYSPKKISEQKGRLEKRLSTHEAPFVILATIGDELVATSALLKYDLDSRKDLEFWLGGVYTKPEYRQSGIAKQLISVVIERAKELGIKRLYLKTEHAQGLYEKLGWQHLDKTTDTNGGLVDLYYWDIV